MKKPTLGEFLVKFEAHEQRDIDRFEQTLKAMKEGFETVNARLEHMNQDMAQRQATALEEMKDHEGRIRIIERYGTLAVGALYVLYALFQFGLLDSIVQKAVRTELSQYDVRLIQPSK